MGCTKTLQKNLAGRTKIITVHSGVWLKNAMDRRLAFRLHVPITSLVAPTGSTNGQQLTSDTILGPLDPGKGTTSHRLSHTICRLGFVQLPSGFS